MKREMRKLLTLQILRVLLVDERGKIASIVENHVQGLTTREACDGLLDAPVVLLLGLALPRKDGHTSGGDAGSEGEYTIICAFMRKLTQRQRGPE